MKPIHFEELQDLQYRILCLFDDYCRKHNLRYYLYAGTLLGALRHKGFIPWDDDIDVIMPRPEYERFLKLAEKEPVSEELAVYSCDTRANCICPFVKLVDERTDGHENHLHKSIRNGVWIDVFPMDGIPAEQPAQDDFIASMQKKIKLLELSARPLVFTPNPLRMAKRLAIYLRYHHIDSIALAKELEVLAVTYPYETAEYIGVAVFGGGKNNVIKKEGFEDTAYLPFRDREFPVPGTYEEYLSHLFGPTYMTPPPEKQQIRKHGYDAYWKDGMESESTYPAE